MIEFLLNIVVSGLCHGQVMCKKCSVYNIAQSHTYSICGNLKRILVILKAGLDSATLGHMNLITGYHPGADPELKRRERAP